MPFYVVYDLGSCNDGSHDCGWEKFATKDEATARALELQTKAILCPGPVMMIEGDRVIFDGEADP